MTYGRHLRLCLLTLIAPGLFPVLPTRLAADEPDPGFATLRFQAERETVLRVNRWIAEHPDSAERFDAAAWSLTESLENGWYAEGAAVAAQVLEWPDASPAVQLQARQIRCLAQAADGDVTGAIALFQDELKRIRIRNPNDTLEFAFALCGQFQISGDRDAAQEVIKATANAFFLNEEVRTICDRRLAKLLLLGTTPEDFIWTTVTGQPGKLSALRGQPVLIDFWATNCPPCIADLPALKATHHRHDLAIVGLSLDRTEADVTGFAQQQHIGWPLALVTTSPDSPRDKFRVVTIPATFLLDGEGKIILVDGTAREIELMLQRLNLEE
jgi:thiol-disulfide isomerase/thioredoxin